MVYEFFFCDSSQDVPKADMMNVLKATANASEFYTLTQKEHI
jgi:hypothetical protein